MFETNGLFGNLSAAFKWRWHNPNGSSVPDVVIPWNTLRSAGKVPILGSKGSESKQIDVPNEKWEKTMKVRGIGWSNASSKLDDARRIAKWQIGRGNLQIKSLQTEKEFQAKSKKWRRNCSLTTIGETGGTTLPATDESLKIWNVLHCVPGWLATIRMRITMIRTCTPQSKFLRVKNSTLAAKFWCHLEIVVD